MRDDGLDDDDSEGSEIGGDREQDTSQPDQAAIKEKMKKQMNDDWNYLKKTLNGAGNNKISNNNNNGKGHKPK